MGAAPAEKPAATVSSAPRPRRARPVGLVHAALGLGGFAIGTAEFATMSLLPDFSRGLGVDAPSGGLVISAYALGVVVGAPLFAVFGAKLSRRTLLAAMMVWFALGNGLSALAPSFPALMGLRFLTGLPHGAYFGVAALVAASLVPVERRTAAVGRVMTGFAAATIVGVPLANLLGRALGWRWGFGVVAALALVTAVLVSALAPADPPEATASPVRELGALRRPQVWLTLGVGAIGYGGLFAVYSYLASTLEAAHAPAYATPLALVAFGVGLTLGALLTPRFADRALMPTAGGLLALSAVALAAYAAAVPDWAAMTVAVAAVGACGALGVVLQTRLMDVAGDAQALAAALNHSAFNVANALGPWLAGLALAAGLGWRSTGWVGCGLSLSGLVVWAAALLVDRREPR